MRVQLSTHFAEFVLRSFFDYSDLLLNLARLCGNSGSLSELNFCDKETFGCADAC